MQSAYSWAGTRIHLVLRDDVADAYNRAMDAWTQAQVDHYNRFGTEWDPSDYLWMTLSDFEKAAWNGIARIINLLGEVNGGLDIPEEEITSDYLVKL